MTQPTEERVSRIEGVTEQVSERLGNLEHRQETLRAEMNAGFDAIRAEMHAGDEKLREEMNAGFRRLEDKMDRYFRWMTGALLFTLVALVGSVIGLLATVL